jgi:hypothetical protein
MKKQMRPVANKTASAKAQKGAMMIKPGKGMSEYGGMEKYPNKAAMKKHEKSEGMKMEMKEKMMAGKIKKKK